MASNTPTVLNTSDLRHTDALVIVSTLLQDFYETNNVETIVTSGKILTTLLKNATQPNAEANKRKIRLSNPKIKQHIGNVTGALDLLGLAGFVKSSDGEYLNYAPPTRNALELYLEEDAVATQEQALVQAICQGLAVKIQELEPTLLSRKKKPPSLSSAVASSPTTNSNTTETFLSEEERRQRVIKAKALKKAKKAQRDEAKQRWNENAEDRKLAAQRREALLKAKVEAEAKEGLALNVTVQKKNSPVKKTTGVLPKPFDDPQENQLAAAARARAERAKTPKLNVISSDPQMIRRQLIQETMKDSTLTAKEKQSKVQELMKAGPEALKAAVAMNVAMHNNTAGTGSEGTPMQLDGPAMAASVPPPKEEDTPMDEQDDEKKKPAASSKLKSPPPFTPPNNNDLITARTPTPPSDHWKKFLQTTPRCAEAQGIRESSVFYKINSTATATSSSIPQCLKRLFKELDGLKSALPSDPNCSIWLRFDEETPQYIRALMTAPLPGPTPYSGGLFAFDIHVPNDYPQTNPRVQLLTTGGGKVRFGPNLYANGKVCLSLLGTWAGPKWNPKHSSLHQLLISIQGLILGVEHPYYLEPGHGGWEGNIKEGDFQVTGRTLTGKTSTAEVGVPMQVIMYEDVLRVGTAKFAMHQPLQWALLGSTNKNGLEPFYEIIQAHFGENRQAILAEVRTWMNDGALGRNRSDVAMKQLRINNSNAGPPSKMLPIDELPKVLPKLEGLLAKISMPNTDGAKIAACDSMDTEEDAKPAARPPSPSIKRDNEQSDGELSDASAKRNKTEQPSSDAGGDVVEQKRQQMQDAASKGDYVVAGQLQEEIKRLEKLEREMKEAAEQNDFIRAGRLQAQFKALTATATPSASTAATGSNANQQSASLWNEADDDEDDEDMGDSDDEMGDGPPFASMAAGMGHPLGKNVFAPPSHKNKFRNRNHSWGTGSQLGNTGGSASATAVEQAPAKKAAPKETIPLDQLCRLRIRLPQDESVVEDFNKNDSLSAVYRRLEPLVPDEDRKPSAVAGPAAARAGAFAQPMSHAGFTLLLTRPKREFSLEMHGTKSLVDLNLAPSATLTVMKCSDRGIMYRGEVESRLQGAQGDAMDVEGLTYEGLVELTERVGGAAPQKGASFLNLTHEEFEANTENFSPSTYLEELGESMDEGGEDERRCPICLGNYDETDSTPSLRKVKHCGHIMHTGCLETWLRTNSSCPLCKTSIRAED